MIEGKKREAVLIKWLKQLAEQTGDIRQVVLMEEVIERLKEKES